MDAIKYFEEKKRMLNSLGRRTGVCTGVACSDCPFYRTNNNGIMGCSDFEAVYPEKAIAIVEKWAEEHQQKTMLMDFLEKYPNAPLRLDGTLRVCPWELGYEEKRECFMSCKDCWNRPL